MSHRFDYHGGDDKRMAGCPGDATVQMVQTLVLLVMLDSENTHMPDWDKSREAREAELPVGRISPTVFQL